MSAAAILASLLREALPEATVLDFGLPAGRVFPWWPGARCGIADPAALPPAEAALLRRFRLGPAGLPVCGLDAAADAALLAGAPAALGGVWPPLLVVEGAAPAALTPLLDAGAMLLQHGLTEAMAPPPGPPRGRIMLLGGSVSRIERWDLLLPAAQLGPVFGRMQAAAQPLAAALGGAAQWQIGGRTVMEQLASIGMLALGTEQLPPLRLPGAALAHDLPHLAAGPELPLGTARRLRLLLGALPARPAWLRLRLRGIDPDLGPGLFLDGLRLDAQLRPEGRDWLLEAPVGLRPDRAAVVGLALPERAPPGALLLGLEVGP
ncbi:hypothetical protein E2C06_04180 [Dankookia rubra]|uniref:Uncharacterized protein n=1 Tax=Dankookia rubra TaxID=1442381 RepID=A0A4R5QKN7_9PROT|nr:hypothetical protein [Dankookia rubra]TDH64024.1 hypothetical protein E2C06_04180 [Dankookia rubra]